MIIYCSTIFIVLFTSCIILIVLRMISVGLLNDDDKQYGGYIAFYGIGLLIITTIPTYFKYYCSKEYNETCIQFDTCIKYKKIKNLDLFNYLI